jgi:hypothetical protein
LCSFLHSPVSSSFFGPNICLPLSHPKANTYKTIILSVVLYWYQTWSLYWIRKFIIAFTRIHHLTVSSDNWMQFTLSRRISLRSISCVLHTLPYTNRRLYLNICCFEKYKKRLFIYLFIYYLNSLIRSTFNELIINQCSFKYHFCAD